MKNRAQIIIFSVVGVIVLLAFLILFGVIPGIKKTGPKEFSLTIWGTDKQSTLQGFTERYHSRFPNVNIAYVSKNPDTYEEELLNALAAGIGPDIFSLRNTQINEHKDKLAHLPQKQILFTARDFKSTYFDAASQDLITKDDNILGLPLVVDTLALFYNRDFFNSANIASPPENWQELIDAVKRLTQYNEVGKVTRSGIALGTSLNIEHATDILSAFMIQTGVDLFDRKTGKNTLLGRADTAHVGAQRPAESALSFYTSFGDASKRTYSWSGFFPNSIDAFAKGQTAMIIGYASDIPSIMEKNPHLNFAVAHLPQLEDAAVKIYFGRYDFYGVSKQSKAQDGAWNFLLWLSDKTNDKTLAEALELAPSRRDLVNIAPPKEQLIPFYEQVLSSKTWFIPNEDKTKEIIREMTNSVANRTATVGSAIERANIRLNTLINSTTP